MSPRNKDDKTVETDPRVVESLAASEQEVAPLPAIDLHALCLELCAIAESINTIDVNDGMALANNMPRARARVSEIRTVLESHLPPRVTA